jgi:hypothetical protein
MAEFYVTQERALAPGIAGDWPKIIPKPDSPNGRLVKVEGLQQKMDKESARLDWLMRHLSGAVLREMLGEMTDTGDIEEFRSLIDAQIVGTQAPHQKKQNGN